VYKFTPMGSGGPISFRLRKRSKFNFESFAGRLRKSGSAARYSASRMRSLAFSICGFPWASRLRPLERLPRLRIGPFFSARARFPIPNTASLSGGFQSRSYAPAGQLGKRPGNRAPRSSVRGQADWQPPNTRFRVGEGGDMRASKQQPPRTCQPHIGSASL